MGILGVSMWIKDLREFLKLAGERNGMKGAVKMTFGGAYVERNSQNH
jgi:hypothetical protein